MLCVCYVAVEIPLSPIYIDIGLVLLLLFFRHSSFIAIIHISICRHKNQCRSVPYKSALHKFSDKSHSCNIKIHFNLSYGAQIIKYQKGYVRMSLKKINFLCLFSISLILFFWLLPTSMFVVTSFII